MLRYSRRARKTERFPRRARKTERFSLILGLLAVAACNRDPSGTASRDSNAQEQSGSATLTSSSFTTKESAVDRITSARCAREVTCSNTGPDKRLSTSDHCVSEVKAHLDAELSANECPAGIDAKQVDECLEAIRKESCTNAFTTVERLAECRTSTLCVKTTRRPLL